MRKFNPDHWSKIEDGQEIESAAGIVHVRAAQEVSLFVIVDGVEALAGNGKEIKVRIAKPLTFRVEGGDAFHYTPVREMPVRATEVFTNVDRMPHESGAVLEVRKAMRLFELEQREMLKRMRKERAELDAARQKPEPEPEPVAEPEPEAEPEAE